MGFLQSELDGSINWRFKYYVVSKTTIGLQ